MKKILAILSVSVYLLLQVGVIAHVHTCHQVITSVSFFEVAESCHESIEYTCCSHSETTACCENTANHSPLHCNASQECCNNEVVIIQYANPTQLVPQITSIQAFPVIAFLSTLYEFQAIPESTVTLYNPLDFSPPPVESLFILHCSMIYYS